MLFHFSRVSSNKKTGPIPVTTSSRLTCSPTCPFFNNGCYAESGPLRLHWEKVTKEERGLELPNFLQAIKNLPKGQLWRHNQAGDLPHKNGAIDTDFVRSLYKANKQKRGFTYTHHSLENPENLEIIREANSQGFTINVSTESEVAADSAIKNGLPAVMVAHSEEQRASWRTPDNNLVLVCPAQREENRTCADCGLCQKRGKKVVIAFLSHGTSKKKANSVVLEK